MRRYNPQEIEPKWQKIWEDKKLYAVDTAQADKKFYIIPMFAYPSGDLHIGHWYNFAPTDTVARWQRMRGHNVLHTNGFDAFGLPAENAAIARNIPPAKWTRQNITAMTGQMKAIGASYDWSKSVITSNPEYYRWTQWLFLKLYEKGLAYRAKAVVNWCPKDRTVLANEQVVGEDNVCERCGTPVEQKELEQWFFKITEYAEQLIEDLDSVDWPERVRLMQKNWIGKSQGALIKFQLADSNGHIETFTTRPDTIFGATFLVLAPEHKILNKLSISEEAREYIQQALNKTELERKEAEKDKTGVFTGVYAINPATKEKIPIWVADYVLMNYGTGAIMAVPAHDQRDFEFAQKYDLPIVQVITERFIHEANRHQKDKKLVPRHVVVAVIKHPEKDEYLIARPKGSDYWSPIMGGIDEGETAEQALRRELLEETGYRNVKILKINETPIASEFFAQHKDENRIAYCITVYVELENLEAEKVSEYEQEKQEIQWASKSEMLKKCVGAGALEIINQAFGEVRPMIFEGRMINSGKYNDLLSEDAREKIVADLTKQKIAEEQTNYRLRDWLISRQRYWGAPIPVIYCQKCDIQPVPEDQLPVLLPEDVAFQPTGQSPLKNLPEFVDIQCPKCGGPAKRETDTMDTFVDSSWYFLRYPNPDYSKSPYDPEVVNKWLPVDHYIGGIEHAILHLLYARFITKFLADHHGLAFREPFKKLSNQGIILGPDGQKMSKSRGNVVSPDEQLKSYGADSLRLYLMFMGPYDQGGPYSMGGIAGTRRFLDRIWTIVFEFLEDNKSEPVGEQAELIDKLRISTHSAIKKVSEDLEQLNFNTAISSMMELTNSMYSLKNKLPFFSASGVWRENLEHLLKLLAPFAPHVSEELWQAIGHRNSIHTESWPRCIESYLYGLRKTIAIQVDGKVRATMNLVPDKHSEEEIISLAKNHADIKKRIKNTTIKKEIYVPGRLVSLVTD